MNQTSKETLPLNLDEDERTYINKSQFIVGVTNSIAKKYGHLRQDSKAP